MTSTNNDEHVITIHKLAPEVVEDDDQQLLIRSHLYGNAAVTLPTPTVASEWSALKSTFDKMHVTVKGSLLFAVISAILSVALAIVGLYHERSTTTFCLLTSSMSLVFKVYFDIFKATSDVGVKGIARI